MDRRGDSQVIIPDLGIGDHSIHLKSWLVSTGDKIIAGERIAELLVDSVLFYLEAEENGRIIRFMVSVGAQVVAGECIAEIQLQAIE